ncbi:MAG TPA: class I SAM-dependent methyltransferase [Casimicrobiaceae bacterium]|nr:class I SAM-dependent methyltransferase [Casimicrobiaceae bacterium]
MNSDAPPDRPLLDDQIAYYRARAPEYDAWWFRTGRFDRGADGNAAWRSDVAIAEAAVDDMLMKARPSNVLELACGTGLFTRRLAPRVRCVTAVDASPEVIAINRGRVGSPNVRYVEADLFAFEPGMRYDCVFMSFWLSHVPHARFDAFWSMVRRALAPGGRAFIVDSLHNPTSYAVNHPPPDRDAGIVTRLLDDGREFRIVKVFWEPAKLEARLAACGFAAAIASTPRYFIYGEARVAGDAG